MWKSPQSRGARRVGKGWPEGRGTWAAVAAAGSGDGRSVFIIRRKTTAEEQGLLLSGDGKRVDFNVQFQKCHSLQEVTGRRRRLLQTDKLYFV